MNHLDPHICKSEWSPEEDYIIVNTVLENGRKWALAAKLAGSKRTEHMIKNRYNSLVAKWRGTKKQKEEDVARKILAMLSKTESGPLKD